MNRQTEKILTNTGDGFEASAPGKSRSAFPENSAESSEVPSPPVSVRRYYAEWLAATLISSLLIFIHCGFTADALRLALIISVLCAASAEDIRTRTVPDFYTVIILSISVSAVESLRDIPSIILNLAAVFLPLCVIKHIHPEKSIGGADIKLISACACTLGAARASAALAIALAAAIIVVSLKRKSGCSDRSAPFPLVPFITIGVLASVLL